jgi:pimeloyl-ACP methyl ester carboxylesterase
MRSNRLLASAVIVLSVAVAAGTTAGATASAQPVPATAATPTAVDAVDAVPDGKAAGALTGDRAVVVIEGGGGPHAYTTPWDACDSGRPKYAQAMLDAGLPVFTAPGYGNTYTSTAGEQGCPPQPPTEVQWHTSGYPTQAGEAVLGFLGFLNATYGYRTFDLVGYSYGGLVARATVAALKQQPAAGSLAPAFSYARAAADAGVTIPSIVTINTPHLGSPAYDIAADPGVYLRPVTKAWGRQFANSSKDLIVFQRAEGAGSIHVLETSAHAKRNPRSWDARQVGVLDGVALTLLAGDYCGRTCGDDRATSTTKAALRTDGTVPVYSQLMLPCPKACPSPPGAVYIPPGLLPAEGVVRKTFPTVHSTFVTKGLGLPDVVSVSRNPAAIAYLVGTIQSRWQAEGVPLLPGGAAAAP